MVQRTFTASLPVALGEGSEPLSQGDWNVVNHHEDTNVCIASSEHISVRPSFLCTFPFGSLFGTFESMHFDYAYGRMLSLHSSWWPSSVVFFCVG